MNTSKFIIFTAMKHKQTWNKQGWETLTEVYTLTSHAKDWRRAEPELDSNLAPGTRRRARDNSYFTTCKELEPANSQENRHYHELQLETHDTGMHQSAAWNHRGTKGPDDRLNHTNPVTSRHWEPMDGKIEPPERYRVDSWVILIIKLFR